MVHGIRYAPPARPGNSSSTHKFASVHILKLAFLFRLVWFRTTAYTHLLD